jgi:hypothetical protein
MILPNVLIVIFVLFFATTCYVMVRRGDDLHAMAYLALFVYSVFAQIGYVNYPQFSQEAHAYFGPALFYDYWLFMFGSFFATFLVYLALTTFRRRSRPAYRMIKAPKRAGPVLLCGLVTLLAAVLADYFVSNREAFHWGGGAEYSLWFALGFRLLNAATLVLYIGQRSAVGRPTARRLMRLALVLCLPLVMVVAIAIGSRSDLLFLAIALSFYEMHPLSRFLRLHKRQLAGFVMIGLVIVYALTALSKVRGTTDAVTPSVLWEAISQPDLTMNAEDLARTIILQDYHAPSLTLFLSMANDFVYPDEVFKSNLANLFIWLNYPLLSTSITASVSGAPYARGTGWSYHLFVEGYNAAGWLGIMYNAVAWNLGMLLWKTLASSDDERFNRGVTALLSLWVVAVMRSQSVFFLKILWQGTLPAMVLLGLAMGLRPVFKRRRLVRRSPAALSCQTHNRAL